MKLLIIQTGGTIDKDYPKQTGGYAFEIGAPAVTRIFANIHPLFEYEIFPFLQKDSQEITDIDRKSLKNYCLSTHYDKILITHGTDTMIETAKYISGIQGKVVVITGAMRPEKFSDSDAAFNIGVAMGALNVLNHGVYLAMNGRIYPSNKVQRDMVTGKFCLNSDLEKQD